MRARFKSALGFIMMLLIIAIVLFAFYFVYKKMRSSDGDIKITGDLSINFHNGKKINIDKEFKTKITVILSNNKTINRQIKSNELKMFTSFHKDFPYEKDVIIILNLLILKMLVVLLIH